VQPSRCHSDSLHLEVLSNAPHRSPEATAEPPGPRAPGRTQLVQEVVRLAEEASQQAQEKAAQGSQLSREERAFRQTKGPNLYSLLEEVRELALLDLRELALLDLQACGAGGGGGAGGAGLVGQPGCTTSA